MIGINVIECIISDWANWKCHLQYISHMITRIWSECEILIDRMVHHDIT